MELHKKYMQQNRKRYSILTNQKKNNRTNLNGGTIKIITCNNIKKVWNIKKLCFNKILQMIVNDKKICELVLQTPFNAFSLVPNIVYEFLYVCTTV